MKPVPEIDVMNVKQVVHYLGGNFGTAQVTKLMRAGAIETIVKDGNCMLLTRKKYVDRYLEATFSMPIQNQIINTIPLNIINKKSQKKAS